MLAKGRAGIAMPPNGSLSWGVLLHLTIGFSPFGVFVVSNLRLGPFVN